MKKYSDIRVRFGDLISELSSNCDSVEYNIITTTGGKGSKNLKEVLYNILKLNNLDKNLFNKLEDSLSDNEIQFLNDSFRRMIVSIKCDNKFNYRFFLPFRFSDIDYNGRSLLDHLDVNVSNNGKKKSIYSTVVVSKEPEDIMLNIDDTLINRNEDINFYPKESFKNALDKLYKKRK